MNHTDRDIRPAVYVNDPDDVFGFERPAWQHQGACKGQVDVMFPEDRGDIDTNIDAYVLCHRCPVRVECAVFALEQPSQQLGIWAGLSKRQMRAARRHVAAGDDPVSVHRRIYTPPTEAVCRFCDRTFHTMNPKRTMCHSDLCRATATRVRNRKKDINRGRAA